MKLVNKGRTSTTLLTLYGTVYFTRTYLAPADSKSAEILERDYHCKNIYPLDEALEITNLPFKISWQAMSLIAREATKANSYADAAVELTRLFGEKISISTVERVTEFVGNLMFQEQCEQAQKAEDLSKSRSIDARRIRKQADDILYIETDGAMVHVRDKEHVGMTNTEIALDVSNDDTAGETKHESGWTESKHAICFHARDIKYYFESPDGSRYSGRFEDYLAVIEANEHIKNKKDQTKVLNHKIEQRDCIGLIGKSDWFQYHMQALAERNDWAYTSTVVILSDGATWIKTAKDTVFNRKNVIQILDLFHAKENAGKFANSVKRTAKARKKLADHYCELIEQGKVEQLLAELQPYENVKMKPGVPNLYTYIYNNKDNMDYPRYRKMGLFVGSGAMESANIYMMQDRMKLPGMRWNVDRGRMMLCLKTHHESHTWSKVDTVLRTYALGQVA